MEYGDYSGILNNLPEPHTMEEQYWYAIVMASAGKTYDAPFDKPFWRIQQYMYAWWQITTAQITAKNTPDDNTVSTAKIVDGAVTTAKIADGAVTADKLAEGALTSDKLADSSIASSKLASGAVTTSKIANGAVTAAKLDADVEALLLGIGRVTEEMLSDEVKAKLLGKDRVTTEMIQDGAVTPEKLG